MDASKSGLGACILQDGHPIAYASRSLIQAEEHYAQIEKELLAVVFGSERFNHYVYGRPVDAALTALRLKTWPCECISAEGLYCGHLNILKNLPADDI